MCLGPPSNYCLIEDSCTLYTCEHFKKKILFSFHYADIFLASVLGMAKNISESHTQR